ncbi:MAG: NAD(P)H-dependent glycerol-3-phosphate dehydrogenase [Clostridia bacterium]
MKISVLGSGAFGIAISISLTKNGHDVYVWSHLEEINQELLEKRENVASLKGVKIPDEVNLTSDINCVCDSEIIIIATPSFAVRETLVLIRDMIKSDVAVVILAKGIVHEGDEYLVFSQLAIRILKEHQPVVALTGPTHAEEVAICRPSAILSASTDEIASKKVQDAFMSDSFRVYTAKDVLGAQLGGAFKNVIALAAGICDGMGFGDNASAALITRGFVEISRLGVQMGAKKDTFSGLSGIGDLIVTCMSVHSRNRRAGKLIGQGYKTKEAMEEVGSVVEGYYATKFGYELSKLYNIEMPIVEAVYNVLYNEDKPYEAFLSLMNRTGKSEIDDAF